MNRFYPFFLTGLLCFRLTNAHPNYGEYHSNTCVDQPSISSLPPTSITSQSIITITTPPPLTKSIAAKVQEETVVVVYAQIHIVLTVVSVTVTVCQTFDITQKCASNGVCVVGPIFGERTTYTITNGPTVVSFKTIRTSLTSFRSTATRTLYPYNIKYAIDLPTGLPFKIKAQNENRYVRIQGKGGVIVDSKDDATIFRRTTAGRVLLNNVDVVGWYGWEYRQGFGRFRLNGNGDSNGWVARDSSLNWANSGFPSRPAGFCMKGRNLYVQFDRNKGPSGCRTIELSYLS